jgi:hypothetical protein
MTVIKSRNLTFEPRTCGRFMISRHTSFTIQCKMEKKIYPGFFNPMQHLLIHLSYEAKVSGHVQYTWMYHIKRALKYLRARVEGCIVKAFTLNEVAYFSSFYFA